METHDADDDADDDEEQHGDGGGGEQFGEQFGAPYEVDDESDESDDDGMDEGEGEDNVSDELRFSNERFFSARLHELLHGSMLGGSPASQTGLLTGVRPMLLHQTQSPHPERPARMVAIYNEIIERGLDARSRLVPARLASVDDLKLVHTAEQVAKSTGSYTSKQPALRLQRRKPKPMLDLLSSY